MGHVRKYIQSNNKIEKYKIIGRDAPIKDSTTGFYFLWESTYQSWIIGQESDVSANAVDGVANCKEPLEIPSEFTYDGITSPVETIGKKAFEKCAYQSTSITRTVFITKQVKVIKNLAFGYSSYVSNFTIEAGSQLEEIESFCFYNVGFSAATKYTKTLFLPATLNTIGNKCFQKCYLFTEVIYCGIIDFSEGEFALEGAIVRVKKNYPAAIALGLDADKTFDISQICNDFALIPRSTPDLPPLINIIQIPSTLAVFTAPLSYGYQDLDPY